jgi:hypothetical protein
MQSEARAHKTIEQKYRELSETLKYTVYHENLRSCNLLVCTGDDKISTIHGY